MRISIMRPPLTILGNPEKHIIIIAFLMILALTVFPGVSAAGESAKTYKILHIMSYHSPWKWTDDQFNGFKRGLKINNAVYKVFQMDVKRDHSEASIKKAALQARQLIDRWKPDLIYVNDDAAQEHITKYYRNSDIPFVFSGVNINPMKYGFLGTKNITGVMEHEHFIETLQLLRKIVPGVNRIAVIFDEGPTWEGVGGRMLAKLPRLSGIRVVSWSIVKSYREYKHLIKKLQTEVEAIALLGIFTFKDEHGRQVPYTEVLRWTAENSGLPDFTFWKDRISYGTLCAVTVSGFEQGLAAGRLARKILLEQIPPSALTMKPSLKGEPVISLARAKKLGIKIPADILLSAEVVTQFKWDIK